MSVPSALGARVIGSTGVILAAAVLVFAPRWLSVPLLILLAVLAAREMYALLSARGPRLPEGAGLAASVLLILSAAVGGTPGLAVAAFVAAAVPLMAVVLAGPRPEALLVWACTAIGSLYVALPLAHADLIRGLPSGRNWLLFAIVATWITDTGAYFAGSFFGRRKLAPSISPGKTVDGAIGAVLLTAVLGTLLGTSLRLPATLLELLVTAVLVSLVVQSGDLAESYIKRAAGKKDSGQLIPGHGGLLDRIDGLLWALVTVYYAALLLS